MSKRNSANVALPIRLTIIIESLFIGAVTNHASARQLDTARMMNGSIIPFLISCEFSIYPMTI